MRRPGTGVAALGAALIAAALGVAPAAAQPADVAAQIKLVESQPADMDRSTWKERRRDAARKLGQSKDRRAVPVLIKLAETETFDIIGEIAIDALGNLGDPSAGPVLQRIVADPARDKGQRDLARKALGKLRDGRERNRRPRRHRSGRCWLDGERSERRAQAARGRQQRGSG
jgi:HEAT repeat protein